MFIKNILLTNNCAALKGKYHEMDFLLFNPISDDDLGFPVFFLVIVQKSGLFSSAFFRKKIFLNKCSPSYIRSKGNERNQLELCPRIT
jgi:hypothetical protein